MAVKGQIAHEFFVIWEVDTVTLRSMIFGRFSKHFRFMWFLLSCAVFHSPDIIQHVRDQSYIGKKYRKKQAKRRTHCYSGIVKDYKGVSIYDQDNLIIFCTKCQDYNTIASINIK